MLWSPVASPASPGQTHRSRCCRPTQTHHVRAVLWVLPFFVGMHGCVCMARGDSVSRAEQTRFSHCFTARERQSGQGEPRARGKPAGAAAEPRQARPRGRRSSLLRDERCRATGLSFTNDKAKSWSINGCVPSSRNLTPSTKPFLWLKLKANRAGAGAVS